MADLPEYMRLAQIDQPVPDVEFGGKVTHNSDLVRSTYAIKDASKKLHENINWHMVNSDLHPHEEFINHCKKGFFVKESRIYYPDSYESQLKDEKDKGVANHVEGYINSYKTNARLIEDTADCLVAKGKEKIAKRIPIPGWAKKELGRINARDTGIKINPLTAGGISKIKEEFEPKLKVPKRKKALFNNSKKVKEKIQIGEPVFKREKRQEKIFEGWTHLLNKIGDTEKTLREIKNGQTIFDRPALKVKYDNPFFKKQEMKEGLIQYIDKMKPKTKYDPVTNMIQEEGQPLPLNEFSITARSFLPKETNSVVSHFYSTQTAMFGFKSINDPPCSHATTERKPWKGRDPQSSLAFNTTAHTSMFPEQKSSMQMTERMQRDVQTGSSVGKSKTQRIQLANGLKPETAEFTLQQKTQSQRTKPRAAAVSLDVNAGKKKSSEDETVFQLRPYQLHKRAKGNDLLKHLQYPQSPSFVHKYDIANKIVLERAVDHCTKRNVPFCTEEDKWYKVYQGKKRFGQYKKTIDTCFETKRPSEFEVGRNLIKGKKPMCPKQQLSPYYTDLQCYMPHICGKVPETPNNKPAGAESIWGINSPSPSSKVASPREAQADLKSVCPKSIPAVQQSGKTKSAWNFYTDKKDEKKKGVFVKVKQQAKELTETYAPEAENEDDAKFAYDQSTLRDPQKAMEYFKQGEIFKAKMVKELKKKLVAPISVDAQNKQIAKEKRKRMRAIQEDTPKKMQVRDKRPDPMRKIVKVNDKVYKFSKLMNFKLLKILERVELDRPILFHDKLDILWDKADDSTEEPPNDEPYHYYGDPEYDRDLKAGKRDNVNRRTLQRRLTERKIDRGTANMHQLEAYKKMLLILSRRKIEYPILERTIQDYTRVEEVEREFLDAFRVIIQSGYFVSQDDFIELLQLLKISKNVPTIQRKTQVVSFFKEIAGILDFNVDKIEEAITYPWLEQAVDTDSEWDENNMDSEGSDFSYDSEDVQNPRLNIQDNALSRDELYESKIEEETPSKSKTIKITDNSNESFN